MTDPRNPDPITGPPPPPRPSRVQRALEVLLLLAPLGLLLAGILAIPGHRPAGLTRGAEIIRVGVEKGDLILFAGLAAQDLAAELRGLPFLPLPAGARIPTEGFGRVWVLDARPKGPRADLAALPAAREKHELRGLTVSLHFLTRHSFADRLGGALVELLPDLPAGAPAASCPAKKPALFQCPVRPRVQVQRQAERGRDGLVPCVSASLVPGDTLRIRFPGMPVGDLLQIRTSLPPSVGPTAPVHVEVRIDGQAVLQFAHRTAAGWEDREVETRARRGARQVEIRLRVDREGKQPFCFTGGTR